MTAPRPYIDLGFADAVAAERRHQNAKWGTVDDTIHSWADWSLILNREVGEANDAFGRLNWFEGPWNDTGYLCDLRSELIQVAAVCAQVIDKIDDALDPTES